MAKKNEKISIISINQSGGITAHTVNINQAPTPTLKARTLFLNQSRGSEYHSRIELIVESPYPPANLYVAVAAPSIVSIDFDAATNWNRDAWPLRQTRRMGLCQPAKSARSTRAIEHWLGSDMRPNISVNLDLRKHGCAPPHR